MEGAGTMNLGELQTALEEAKQQLLDKGADPSTIKNVDVMIYTNGPELNCYPIKAVKALMTFSAADGRPFSIMLLNTEKL